MKREVEAEGQSCRVIWAAARLGIPPSTLDSKITHLGIPKRKLIASS